jgi:hypothetical protein
MSARLGRLVRIKAKKTLAKFDLSKILNFHDGLNYKHITIVMMIIKVMPQL